MDASTHGLSLGRFQPILILLKQDPVAVFNNKKTPQEGNQEFVLSTIANGTTIVGDIVSDGDIRVEGRIIGKLVCKSRLVIGKKGVIEGNIDVSNATIEGQIHGTVVVRDLLHVKSTGLIRGDVCTGRIIVDDGGEYTGNSKTGKNAREALKSIPIPDLLPKNEQRLKNADATTAKPQNPQQGQQQQRQQQKVQPLAPSNQGQQQSKAK